MSDHRHENANRENLSVTWARLGSNPVPLARFIQVLFGLVAAAAIGVALAATPIAGPLAFSNDGKTLIGVVNGSLRFSLRDPLSFYGTVKVWNVDSGSVRATLSGPAAWLRSIAISPDGSTLAVAGDSPSIELWNVDRAIRMRRLGKPHAKCRRAGIRSHWRDSRFSEP